MAENRDLNPGNEPPAELEEAIRKGVQVAQASEPPPPAPVSPDTSHPGSDASGTDEEG